MAILWGDRDRFKGHVAGRVQRKQAGQCPACCGDGSSLPVYQLVSTEPLNFSSTNFFTSGER